MKGLIAFSLASTEVKSEHFFFLWNSICVVPPSFNISMKHLWVTNAKNGQNCLQISKANSVSSKCKSIKRLKFFSKGGMVLEHQIVLLLKQLDIVGSEVIPRANENNMVNFFFFHFCSLSRISRAINPTFCFNTKRYGFLQANPRFQWPTTSILDVSYVAFHYWPVY